MKTTLLTFTLSVLLCTLGLAQQFSISNSDKTYRFSSSTLVECSLRPNEEDSNRFTQIDFFGHVMDVSADSVLFKLNRQRLYYNFDCQGVDTYDNLTDISLNQWIAKDDVWYCQFYKSEKQRKNLDRWSIVSGLLAFSGIGTSIGALLVDDKSDKQNLLIAGVAQIVGGITIGVSTTKPKRRFKLTDDAWTFD